MEAPGPSEQEQKQKHMMNEDGLEVCGSRGSEGSRLDETNTSHCVDL